MDSAAPVHVVTGGTGFTGEHLVRAVLGQFPGATVPVITRSFVRRPEEVERAVRDAAAAGGTIVDTLVDPGLRARLAERAAEAGVVRIDLFGELLRRFETQLGREPEGRAGLYRQLRRDYFERMDAIEFTTAHDDGKDPEGWPAADVVIVGASRVGKTPLAMYLSVMGWKAANVPIVPGIAPPGGLDEVDRRRVVGLTIDPEELLSHRRHRLRRMGPADLSGYTDDRAVFEELEHCRDLCRRRGWSVIDVSDKPKETTADEIIELISGRFGED